MQERVRGRGAGLAHVDGWFEFEVVKSKDKELFRRKLGQARAFLRRPGQRTGGADGGGMAGFVGPRRGRRGPGWQTQSGGPPRPEHVCA